VIKTMKMFRLITATTPVIVLALLLILTTPAQGDQPALQENLLLNPSFEEGSYPYFDDPLRMIPNGWEPWWDPGFDPPRYNLSEGVPERVYNGWRSASYWEQYRDFDGGLFQRVAATQGTTYRFTIHGHAISESNVKMQVGISKKGGFDHTSADIVWSGGKNVKDTYGDFSVEATAEFVEVTVFVRGSPDYPVAQTDFYWDEASLVVVSSAPPTEKPEEDKPEEEQQQQQPQSSGVTVGSIPKSTPAPDGSVVHTVQAGETLIGIAVTYEVTLEELRANNNLTTDMVFVGQQLVIKLPGSEPPPQAEAEEAESESGGNQPTPTAASEVAESGAEQSQPAAASGNGTVCVMSYEDSNANGIRDGGESTLAGITFAVSDSTQIVAQYTTDGNEPYCFTELVPGTYIVSWTGDQYTATTDQTWATSVAAGATVSREFGAQSTGEAAQGSGSSKPDREGGLPVWATALIGAVGVIFFLSGIGAAAYFLVIRRGAKI
jgi:LysM repeat protein